MKLLRLPSAAAGPVHPARAMRRVATGMLVAMAALFALARATAHLHPAIGFAQAFAEAAMVGGLADWFAVTALFRHPLGLPIPHTAIIPRNKDRIGDTLALFLRDNFLTPAVVARRMQRLDVAGAAGFLQRRCLFSESTTISCFRFEALSSCLVFQPKRMPIAQRSSLNELATTLPAVRHRLMRTTPCFISSD